VIAIIFAELSGCVPAWERGLEDFEMTESQVVNNWISKGSAQGKLEERRQMLLECLQERFPGATSTEVVQLIQQQDSMDLLRDWSRAAYCASTYEEFLAVLKR
jgi:hypothetical protein